MGCPDGVGVIFGVPLSYSISARPRTLGCQIPDERTATAWDGAVELHRQLVEAGTCIVDRGEVRGVPARMRQVRVRPGSSTRSAACAETA